MAEIIAEFFGVIGEDMIPPDNLAELIPCLLTVFIGVALSIPYENFVSLEQIVLAAERNQEYDNEHHTLTVTLVLGDEFSVQMNS